MKNDFEIALNSVFAILLKNAFFTFFSLAAVLNSLFT